MKTYFKEYDTASYLDSDQIMEGHLREALQDGDPALILMALDDIAKAKGMSNLAGKTGLGRESLYKALKPGAKPRFETILKIIRSLGFTLSIQSDHSIAAAEASGKYTTSGKS